MQNVMSINSSYSITVMPVALCDRDISLAPFETFEDPLVGVGLRCIVTVAFLLFVPCTNILTYLLTYLLTVNHSKHKTQSW